MLKIQDSQDSFLSSYNIFDRTSNQWFLQINLESSLSHIGESVGNQSNLKTMDLIDLNDQPTKSFVFSGNAIRNRILRRVGITYVCDQLKIKLDPNLHHTFFAGGRIDSSTSSDIELDNKIRKILPWISVLGTAKPKGVLGSNTSQMIPGRINIGNGFLVCLETIEYFYRQLPGILAPDEINILESILDKKSKLSSDPFSQSTKEEQQAFKTILSEKLPELRLLRKPWTKYITENQITRRDSLEDPQLSKYIGAPIIKGSKNKSDKMIASSRLLKMGSKLVSRWDANLTDIETGFVLRSLVEFARSPYLGGMNSRGNGLVSFILWKKDPSEKIIDATVNQAIKLSDYGQEKLDLFDKFLTELEALLQSGLDFKDNQYLNLLNDHLVLEELAVAKSTN